MQRLLRKLGIGVVTMSCLSALMLGASAPADAAYIAACVVEAKPMSWPQPPKSERRCFETMADAVSFATQGAVQVSRSLSPREVVNGNYTFRAQVDNSLATNRIWSILFRDMNIGGQALIVYGQGDCEAGKNYGVADLRDMGPSDGMFNDSISSFAGFNNCWTELLEHPGYGGTSDGGYIVAQPAWNLNDRASALVLHAELTDREIVDYCAEKPDNCRSDKTGGTRYIGSENKQLELYSINCTGIEQRRIIKESLSNSSSFTVGAKVTAEVGSGAISPIYWRIALEASFSHTWGVELIRSKDDWQAVAPYTINEMYSFNPRKETSGVVHVSSPTPDPALHYHLNWSRALTTTDPTEVPGVIWRDHPITGPEWQTYCGNGQTVYEKDFRP